MNKLRACEEIKQHEDHTARRKKDRVIKTECVDKETHRQGTHRRTACKSELVDGKYPRTVAIWCFHLHNHSCERHRDTRTQTPHEAEAAIGHETHFKMKEGEEDNAGARPHAQ